MGGPPTLNLLREIYLIIGLTTNNRTLALPLSLSAFLAAGYTLILYSSSQQGQLTASGRPYAPTRILQITFLFSLALSLIVSPLIVFLL